MERQICVCLWDVCMNWLPWPSRLKIIRRVIVSIFCFFHHQEHVPVCRDNCFPVQPNPTRPLKTATVKSNKKWLKCALSTHQHSRCCYTRFSIAVTEQLSLNISGITFHLILFNASAKKGDILYQQLKAFMCLLLNIHTQNICIQELKMNRNQTTADISHFS